MYQMLSVNCRKSARKWKKTATTTTEGNEKKKVNGMGERWSGMEQRKLKGAESLQNEETCVSICGVSTCTTSNYLLNENAHLWNVYINKTNTHQFALESLMP